MSALLIKMTGTGSDGSTVTVQASVTDAPPAVVAPGPGRAQLPHDPSPETLLAPPGPADAPQPYYREPEPPPPLPPAIALSDAPQLMSQPVQIPGFGNASGHQTTATASKAKPVMAPQSVTSQILFSRTGGFR
jgi:hypothetical protein